MQQNPKLTQMLVKRLLKKHGIDHSKIELSDEEKDELKEVVSSMQDSVEQFLAGEQFSDKEDEEEKES
ncbi:hypothetical protein D7Z54_03335 [Salibacterium salarium]|uniref:Spore coat protein W n=1 Tax=Salibacterium salarium TaxID=284579 RepID=A0A428N958_9BACI|nr:hypothetical protein [Salibacterium salarium]RSL34881.1 hypothetical protein D7Z54_03335 [Salibacterium salarium]